jgi:hypothetical protein
MILQVVLFLCSNSSAANTVNWFRSFGSSCWDEVRDIYYSAPDGKILMTGYLSFRGALQSIVCDSTPGLLLGKLNLNGNQIWCKHEGMTDVFGESITMDTDGNFYVAGEFSRTAIFAKDTIKTNNIYTMMNRFLIKYNSNGEILWVRKQGSNRSMYGWGPIIGPNKNLFIVCHYEDTLFLEGKKITSLPDNAATQIIEYSPDGQVIQSKTLSYYISGIQAIGPNIFICGGLNKSGMLDKYYNIPDGLSMEFVATIDQTTFTPTVLFSMYGNDYDFISTFLVKDNNIFVAGSFTDSLNINNYGTITTNVLYKKFFINLDKTGNIKWVKLPDTCISRNHYEYLPKTNSIAVDKNNNVYFAGTYEGYMKLGPYTLSQIPGAKNGTDIFVVGFSSIGIPITAFGMDSPGEDNCTKIILINDTTMNMSGSFSDTITSGTQKFIGDPDKTDGFVASIGLSLPSVKSLNSKLPVRKKPSVVFVNDRLLSIQNSNEMLSGKFVISDLAGKEIINSFDLREKNYIDMKRYASGIYFLHSENFKGNAIRFLLR